MSWLVAGQAQEQALIAAKATPVGAADLRRSGPPGTRTLNPSGGLWIISDRADRRPDLGAVSCCLAAVDSPCRRQLCPACAR